MVTSVTSPEQYLDTGIANFGMVMNEPTPTAVQSEQSDDTPSPQEMAEAQRAMNKLLSERGELEAALNDPSLSAEQKDSLKKSQQIVSSSIGSLNAAIGSKSRMGITAALQIAALATAGAQSAETKSEAATHLSSGASYGGGEYESNMRATSYNQLSASAKNTYNTMNTLNIAALDGLNEVSRVNLAARLDAELPPEVKAQAQVAANIEKSPILKEMKVEAIQQSQVATDEALALARSKNNKEMEKAILDSQKISAEHGITDYSMKERLEKLKSGELNEQQFTQQQNAKNQERDARYDKINADSFNNLKDFEKAHLRKTMGLSEGQQPTEEQLSELQKKSVNAKDVNDATYVIKTHGLEKGYSMLTDAQKEAYSTRIAQAKGQTERKAVETQEFYQSLTPEQKEKFNAEYIRLYKESPEKAMQYAKDFGAENKISNAAVNSFNDAASKVDSRVMGDYLNASSSVGNTVDDYKVQTYIENYKTGMAIGLTGEKLEQFARQDYVLAYDKSLTAKDYEQFYTLSPDAKATTTTNAALSASLAMDTPAAGSPATGTTVAAGAAAAGASAGMFARTSTDDSATGGSTDTTTESQAVGAAAQVKVAAPSLTVSDPNQRIIAPEATQTTPSTDTKDLQAALANGGFSQGALTVGSTATASPAQEQAQAVAQQQNQQPSSGSTSLSQALANGGFNTVAFQQQLQGTPVVITSANENIAPAIVPNVIAAAGTTPIQRA
jgi:hypothetical protein